MVQADAPVLIRDDIMPNNADVIAVMVTVPGKPATSNTNTEYQEYLQSPRWLKMRRLVMLRAKYQCEVCLRRRGQHAAHLTYDRIFHELPTDLVWVCARCHGDLDERQQKEHGGGT